MNQCRNRIMISGPSLHAEHERRLRMTASLTESDVGRELGLATWYVKSLRERGLLQPSNDRVTARGPTIAPRWRRCGQRIGRGTQKRGQVRERGRSSKSSQIAQHAFVRTYGDQVANVRLLVSGQQQYLRTTSSNLLRGSCDLLAVSSKQPNPNGKPDP